MKNTVFLLLAFCLSAFATAATPSMGDPIFIEPGTPTIVVVSVFAEDDDKATDFYAKREMAELQVNFPEYDILLADEFRSIVFRNNKKDIVNLSDPNQSMELVVFWDGNEASPIKVAKQKVKCTEFVAGLTGQDVTSSYLAQNEAMLAEYNKKKATFNPDKDSKAFCQYYIIDMYFNKMVYGPIEYFKPQNYTGITSVTVYAQLDDNPEELAFKMNFNAKNQVTDILYAKRSNSNGTVFMVFSYDKNGLLNKMISNENFDNNAQSDLSLFAYDTNKIYQYAEDGMWEFSMQNGILVNDNYMEFENIATDYRIVTAGQDITDNCLNSYDDGVITKSYCPSGFDGTLPYGYVNMLYEDGSLTHRATSKIEETAPGVYTIFNFASAINEYRKVGEVTVKNGLTQSISILARQQNYTLRFEYK